MAHKDIRVLDIEQLLNTRRRIHEIERKALAKISAKVPRINAKAPSGVLCSFCGIAEEEAHFLIHGNGEAHICANCITIIQGLLNDASDA